MADIRLSNALVGHYFSSKTGLQSIILICTVKLEKIEKNEEFFYLRMGDRILMKFDFWKDIVSQSSYFKSRSDPVTLGGVWRGPKILENVLSLGGLMGRVYSE